MRKVKVGIVGVGGIAEWKHMPSLSKCENVEIVAFCDIIKERAEKGAKNFGVPGAKVFTDYKELLQIKEIEVVHVCTPNDMHAPISIAAMEAGKHVMCEKPMAKTAADAKAMYETSIKTGKKLTIGYQARSNPGSLYLKKLIEKGELGDIYFAKASAFRRRGVPTWGVFLDKEKQGGGPLIDIATHSLDHTLWLMDNYEPVSVTGSVFYKMNNLDVAATNEWGSWDPATFTVEDSAFGFIKFKNGAAVALDCSWALNAIPNDQGNTTLCGTKAGADFNDGLRINGGKDGTLYINKVEANYLARPLFNRENLEANDYEARQWIYSIVNGTEPVVKPYQAYIVSLLLESIYKSAETGKEIILNL